MTMTEPTVIFSEADINKANKELFASGKQVYLITTGGAAGVQKMIWETPGASSGLVGCEFPYKQQIFNKTVHMDWNASGKSYASMEAAIALAQNAYHTCLDAFFQSGEFGVECIGIGVSAAVQTNRTLRGGTRVHVVAQTERGLYHAQINLNQGTLGRVGDGDLCDILALNMALFAAGINQVIFGGDLQITSDQIEINDGKYILVPKLLEYAADSFMRNNGRIIINIHGEQELVHERNISFDPNIDIIYPGSFKILTPGHLSLARRIKEMAEKQVFFEIAMGNADKGSIDFKEALRRAEQLRGLFPVILCWDSDLFVQKARMFNNCSFVTGYDTAARILNLAYYNNDLDNAYAALDQFVNNGVRFYVVGRWDDMNKRFMQVADLRPPLRYAHLFIDAPGRYDVSSSSVAKARDERNK